MKIEITSREANVIQVAIDHLYDEHSDVLADAIRLRRFRSDPFFSSHTADV
jgi:hypothetical protein